MRGNSTSRAYTLKKFLRFSIGFVFALNIILMLWMLIANTRNMKDEYFLVPLVLLFIISFFVLVSTRKLGAIVNYIRQHKKILIALGVIIVLLSLAARFAFLNLSYEPQSDPGGFYYSANSIATGALSEDRAYLVATLPYFFAYDALLGGAMMIFGTGHAAVIILNTLLDVIAVVLLYCLVRNVTGNKKIAIIAALLWITSPFNIIFSAISLPVIAVNMLIIASLLLIHTMISHRDSWRKILLYSIVAGVIFALSNAFRPIMIVFVVGLAIYYVFLLINKFSTGLLRNLVMSFTIIVTVVYALNIGYLNLVSLATGHNSTANSGGWSVYVGANYQSWGQWNKKDNEYFFHQLRQEESTLTQAHDRIQKEGWERYKKLSPGQLLDFMVKKSVILGGDQQHSIYNLSSYPDFWSVKDTKLVVWLVSALYSLILIALTAVYFVRRYRSKDIRLDFMFYLAMVFVGLFAAFLLVEIANRYFTPFFIFLTIFASITLYELLRDVSGASGTRKKTRKDS